MTEREKNILQQLGEQIIDANEAARRCGVRTPALIRWIRIGKPVGTSRVKLDGYQSGRSG